MKSLVALLSRPGAPSSMPLPERLQPTALMARARALVRQFNQRNQRERLLLCAALVAVTYMLADALWLASAFTAFRSARTADASMQTALSAQRQQMEDARQPGALPAQRRQAELLDWRQRVRQGDATLRTHEDALVGPDRMVGLLEQLLARHGEVRVRAMRSLGRQDLLAPATAAVRDRADTLIILIVHCLLDASVIKTWSFNKTHPNLGLATVRLSVRKQV